MINSIIHNAPAITAGLIFAYGALMFAASVAFGIDTE